MASLLYFNIDIYSMVIGGLNSSGQVKPIIYI